LRFTKNVSTVKNNKEKELKKAEEDLLVEKAEATCYNMLIQKSNILYFCSEFRLNFFYIE